ncbi:MAG: hypothetical protein ACRDRP_10895 [Pseudonocardiaceae bacterium]
MACWKLFGAQDGAAAEVSATGRMIGGCLETVLMLPGLPYGDVPRCGLAQRSAL